jgi:thioredoxin 1
VIFVVHEINDNNFEELIKKNDTVVVDFYANWCQPCKVLASVLEDVSNTHQFQDDSATMFCKLNVENNPKSTRKFGVLSVPRLMSFKDGEVYKETLGLVSSQEIIELVR